MTFSRSPGTSADDVARRLRLRAENGGQRVRRRTSPANARTPVTIS